MKTPVWWNRRKPIHGLSNSRKAINVIFTFLTNQQLALRVIGLRAHPWAHDNFLGSHHPWVKKQDENTVIALYSL
jgi:hypothetical protein